MNLRASRGGSLWPRKSHIANVELKDGVTSDHVASLQKLRMDQSKAPEATQRTSVGTAPPRAVNATTRDGLCDDLKLELACSLHIYLHLDTQVASSVLGFYIFRARHSPRLTVSLPSAPPQLSDFPYQYTLVSLFSWCSCIQDASYRRTQKYETSEVSISQPSPEDPTLLTSRRLFKSSIIELVVGQKPKRYQIHENILCADSPYFQRCVLSAEIEESTSKNIKLPDVDSAMFEEIVGWMYDKTLNTYAKIAEAENLPGFIRFYTRADKLEIEVLQNKVQAKIKGWLDMEKVTPALLEIVPDGPLKTLVIDQLAFDIVERDLFNDASEGEATKQLIIGGDKHAIDILNSMAKITGFNVHMKGQNGIQVGYTTRITVKQLFRRAWPQVAGIS